jgi:arylsulfatase A
MIMENIQAMIMRALALCIFVFGVSCSPEKSIEGPPNIILILTDDQGWTSHSYLADPERPDSGSDYFETPNMDRMAEMGMRFTDGYAPNPICDPTRHAILFGQNCARHVYNKDETWMERAPGWLTLPKAIKAGNSNYRTAHFGKWHIGILPQDAGYDVSDGPTSNATGNFQNGKYNTTYGNRAFQSAVDAYNSNRGIVPKELNVRYTGEFPVFYSDENPKDVVGLTRRASGFIRESVADNRPFFAQISHYAAHVDMVARQETYNYFEKKPRGTKHDNAGFAAMLKDMDTSFGELLSLLQELEIEDNTYVFLLADNGSVHYFTQTAILGECTEVLDTHETAVEWRNEPLRHGKHEYYEGGIRVPFLALGPGIKPDSVSRVPVTGLDLLPTFAELAGNDEELPDDLDGGSLMDLLHRGKKGEVKRSREALFFHQSAMRPAASAMRKGNYKLVKFWRAGKPKLEGKSRFFIRNLGDKPLELYDLSKDLEEQYDLSDELPELANEMNEELISFLKETNAETVYTARKNPYNLLNRRENLPNAKDMVIPMEYVSPF